MEARVMMSDILKLDIDGKEIDYERIKNILEFFNVKANPFGQTKIFMTNRGYHIYIEMGKSIPAKSAVFLQLLMGSDYLREMFNYARINAGIINWNVLFSRKWENNKITSEELAADSETSKLQEVIGKIGEERF